MCKHVYRNYINGHEMLSGFSIKKDPRRNQGVERRYVVIEQKLSREESNKNKEPVERNKVFS